MSMIPMAERVQESLRHRQQQALQRPAEAVPRLPEPPPGPTACAVSVDGGHSAVAEAAGDGRLRVTATLHLDGCGEPASLDALLGAQREAVAAVLAAEHGDLLRRHADLTARVEALHRERAEVRRQRAHVEADRAHVEATLPADAPARLVELEDQAEDLEGRERQLDREVAALQPLAGKALLAVTLVTDQAAQAARSALAALVARHREAALKRALEALAAHPEALAALREAAGWGLALAGLPDANELARLLRLNDLAAEAGRGPAEAVEAAPVDAAPETVEAVPVAEEVPAAEAVPAALEETNGRRGRKRE